MRYVRENNSVEVTLVGKDGRLLPMYEKEGQVYFGGKKGERYELRISNRSGVRIEVVATVDGLSVMSGEPGNWKTGRGYVVNAYDTLKIDGYRRNDNEVAAFRFTNSDDPAEDSYAGRKDMPENLGVIGVAIFKERPKPTYLRTSPSKWWDSRDNFVGGTLNRNITKGLGGSTEMDCSCPCSTSSSSSYSLTSGPEIYGSQEPEIGTEYGEVRDSQVHHVSFTRENHNSPNEVILIEYDTVANLRRRGISTTAPISEEKDAFPGMDGVEPGYAAPPPPRN